MEYDPRLVTVSVDGQLVTGFADDQMIDVEQTDPSVEMTVGSQGEVVADKIHNKTGRIRLFLQHTSPSNPRLAQLANTKRAVRVSIDDRNAVGTAAVSASRGYVERAPEPRGRRTRTKEWSIVCADLQVGPGALFTPPLLGPGF